jgi:hypothetical protein
MRGRVAASHQLHQTIARFVEEIALERLDLRAGDRLGPHERTHERDNGVATVDQQWYKRAPVDAGRSDDENAHQSSPQSAD